MCHKVSHAQRRIDAVEGKLMVNVDATFDTDTGSESTGVIIRDEKGQWIAAAHSFLPHVIDAPMAEAYALKIGLMLAQHIECNLFVIQTASCGDDER